MEESKGGLGVANLLVLIFIVLKLTGYIDWSWWWVLAPIWIPVVVVIVVLLVMLVVIAGK